MKLCEQRISANSSLLVDKYSRFMHLELAFLITLQAPILLLPLLLFLRTFLLKSYVCFCSEIRNSTHAILFGDASAFVDKILPRWFLVPDCENDDTPLKQNNFFFSSFLKTMKIIESLGHSSLDNVSHYCVVLLYDVIPKLLV